MKALTVITPTFILSLSLAGQVSAQTNVKTIRYKSPGHPE